MELLSYYGMASCNGLESFFRDETTDANDINTTALGHEMGDMILGKEENRKKNQAFNAMVHGMTLAAQANPQRYSVALRAKVTEELAELIESTMKYDIVEALNLLKKHATEIALASGVPNAKRFWERIPNPDLDPFGNW